MRRKISHLRRPSDLKRRSQVKRAGDPDAVFVDPFFQMPASVFAIRNFHESFPKVRLVPVEGHELDDFTATANELADGGGLSGIHRRVDALWDDQRAIEYRLAQAAIYIAAEILDWHRGLPTSS